MKRLIFLLVVAGLSGCTAKEELAQSGVKSMAWLAGRWMSDQDSVKFIEEWQDAGIMLTGQGKVIHGPDTSKVERLTIVSDTLGLTYIVDLPNRAVRFVSRGQTETRELRNLRYSERTVVTFANDTNDFPRVITYQKQNSDSLYITLTGSEDGKPMEMIFKMKKLK